MAIEAVMIAAHPIETAGFDKKVRLANVDYFAAHVSDRGTGSASRRLLTLIP